MEQLKASEQAVLGCFVWLIRFVWFVWWWLYVVDLCLLCWSEVKWWLVGCCLCLFIVYVCFCFGSRWLVFVQLVGWMVDDCWLLMCCFLGLFCVISSSYVDYNYLWYVCLFVGLLVRLPCRRQRARRPRSGPTCSRLFVRWRFSCRVCV